MSESTPARVHGVPPAVNRERDKTPPERHDSKLDDPLPPAVPADADADALAGAEPEREGGDVVVAVDNAAGGGTAGTGLSLDTSISHPPPPSLAHRASQPSTSASEALYVSTHGLPPSATTVPGPRLKETPILFDTPVTTDPALLLQHHHMASPPSIPLMGSSLRTTLSTSSIASSVSPSTAASVLASPYLNAMTDITPLPSPLMRSESGGSSWRRSLDRPSESGRSRANSLADRSTPSIPIPQPGSASSPPKRKKGYGSLLQDAVETSWVNSTALDDNTKKGREGHGRNRSISDFVPEQLQNTRQRVVTFGEGDGASMEAHEYHMQREQNLALQRGLTVPLDSRSQRQLPSPPASNSSLLDTSDADDDPQPPLEDGTAAEYLEIHCGLANKRRKFRQLRQLGQGTFSKVMLATRQRVPALPAPDLESHLDPTKLVAVKIVEHGPAGGADEARIETSLKREIDMLKSVSHPSLVHLKACEYQPTRTLLVLTYCPGGDLFDLASSHRPILTAPLVQRIFAELVSAVLYLHSHYIVHRDIKLENVLVNFPVASLSALSALPDPRLHPAPLVTLTDLGLSRRIPLPPASPLLTTRCGSEDYAAPEILLGQPYDGRQTDAWALGVLLYALMEGRLPFDAPPGKPDRSRNTHRIARCDWIWCRFGDEEGEWDEGRAGKGWEGARGVVEGLLRKVRMGRKPLEDVGGGEWVQDGVKVEGGLRVREDDDGLW